MYYCLSCNNYFYDFDMVIYRNRIGFCRECADKTTYEERILIETGGEQMSLF